MKRAISLFLAIVMILSTIPVMALHIHATENEHNPDYAVKAAGENRFAEDIPDISWCPGFYGTTADDFAPVGTTKIEWDPEAGQKLDLTDGDLSDWVEAEYNLHVISASNMVSWVGDVPDDWNICSFFVADSDNLYFGFYITDPDFAYGSGYNYDGDAIQLSLDFGRKLGDQIDEDPYSLYYPKNIFYSFSCNGDGAPITIMRQESDNDGILTEADGVVGTTSRTEGGWCAEFSMSYERLYEDYAWKAWDNSSPIYVGSEENLPLRIGCNLIYIDRAETSGNVNWAAATTNGICCEDGTPVVSWTAYDNGIHLELDYEEGMEFNCGGIVVDGVDRPIGVLNNAADFHTIVTGQESGGQTSYNYIHTTANGWITENAAVYVGGDTVSTPAYPVIGPDNTYKAVNLNGKVSAPGRLTSPTLSGGISKLNMSYTKMFTDTILSVTINITDLATGVVHSQIMTREMPKDEKYTIWEYEWILDTPVMGDFTIEVINNCPSAREANKDRIVILSLTWDSAFADEPEPEPDTPANLPTVEEIEANSSVVFCPGEYSGVAEDFSPVGNIKIEWDPEAFARLDVTDGDMNDWAEADYCPFSIDASNMVSWGGLNDVPEGWSITTFFVADSDNLYFGFYITDPEFAYGSGGNYDGDAIQLSLDFGRKIGDQLDEDPAAVSNPKNIFYSFSCFADGEPLQIMRQESDQDGWLTEADGVVGSASRTENGWCAEFSMSWDRLYEDYEWKAWDEASRIYVGGEEELPLKIGCNLIYIDRSETGGSVNWAACTTNGITYVDGIPAVSWTAYDNGIQLELDYVEGMELNCDGIVVLDGHTPETEPDPANPSNNTNSFISDVGINEVGDSLYDTDLSNFFTVELPLEGSTVVLSEGAKKYELSMISDMYADMNGKYFIRFKDSSFMNQGWMFVRGYKVVVSDEAYDNYADYHGNNGIYPIRNYYETDSSGHMGGAGIYAQLRDGMLNIVLKYYDPNVVTRVGNAYYSIPCGGSELMIADDGKLVSIIVDGTTYATVELSGSVVYADINEVLPRNGFAETAVLRLTTGEAYEIQNTLIACSCESQVGIVVRPGDIRFSAVQVGGYSDVAVPDLGQTAVTPWPEPDIPDPEEPETEPDEPDIPNTDNYNVPQDKWFVTGHCPQIVYKEGMSFSAMVAAAGVDSAALLHQGSIGLGEIDLSKYKKVIITYTTDNSPITQDHYASNPQNRFMLLNADSSMVNSPDASKIVAETTYSLPWSGWQLTTMEIDLTNVDYNGPVYLSWDTLPGTFMLVSSIEFVADDPALDDLVSIWEAGVFANSVDTFLVNGSLYFPQDGDAGSKLDAIGNTITFTADMVHETMTLRGWIGFAQPITSFGYVLDGEIVFGDFEQPTEDGVKWAGGEHALRYAITVPLSHLSDGSHTVAFVILLEDGTLVLLRNPLTVVIGETPDEPDEPDANEIHVTTTDTYGYFDLFSFTAPVSGTYTFNLPTGLGVWDAVKYDTDLSSCPDVDFYDNTDGVSCSIYLVAGETWSFYVGAMIRQDWIITWTVEEDGPGYVDPDPDASYPLWSDHYNVVVHLSFDELYMGMEYPNYDGSKNIFTPGQAASWNGVAYVPDLSVTTLTSLGWVAVRGEVGRFGYQIDNSPFVFDDSFTRATEQIVIDVSQSAGGDTGSRFKIVIDVAGLVGRHTVRTVYQNPAGEIVVLREFTLMMGASEPGEGMWTTHQGINNYPSEDDDPDTVYPPESGYEYTSDGFTVIQPDWTDCIPFVTVSTKEAQSIKNGIYLKFRVDDYSYDGGYHADQWIGLSLNTGYENTGMLQPGSVEYGGGWLTLLRGNGNGLTTGILHLTDPMTEDFGGSFTGVGVSSIPVEVDDQGREIYTLEITWNGYEYEIKINGVMQSNAAQITALLERLSPSGEFFVGVTMHTAVRGGSAGLTILEYGTSEAMAIKPLGIDRKEPGENDVAIVPIIDPDTVPENTPAILWDPSTYDLQYGNNIHFTPNDDNTWKAIATDSSVFFQLSTKRKWSYAAENFPVFGIMVRNLWAESGALWYAAGEFFTATGGNVIPFSIYDGEFYGANEEYIFVPIDLTDLWEGRINSIRLDLFFEHQDRREFDLCFVGMFRSEEEAYTYAQAYLAEQGVGCDHEYEILVTPPTCTDIGFTTYMCSCGDVYRDDIVPPLGHSYVTYMIREATCTESGIRHSECSRCGTVLENIYIPATGHSYVTYMIREATCTEPGIMEHTCEDCGDTYPTYVYSEHRYVLNVHVDATCEADGKNTYTCDRCGDSYDEIIPGAHSYTAEITKIATEEEEGIITYTCSICGHSYTDIIPVRSSASVLLIQDRMPWDHNDNVLLLNHLKDAGYILGWDMVTTSTFRAADLAGYSVVMIANDQTTGAYDRLAALHDALTSYVRAGGVVIYGACDSGWAGGDIRSPLPGGVVKENFYSRYNYIADRLHPIVTGAMTDQKALTDALLYGNYCSHTYFHSDTIPADANIILRDAYGNPTLVEYAIGDGHVIASGLTWEFYYNRNAYEGGSLTYSKSVFDDLVVYAIGLSDPCEHIFDMGTVYGPTCTEDGYTLHTCLNCGLQMKDTFLPALGHTLGEWTVAYPATTEVNGLKQRCCTLCGAVLAEEIIPMLNAPIIQVQAPTDTVILGQEITFSVVIENCRPVKSLAVVPIFDTSVFELVDLRWTISALMQNIEPDTLRAVSVWSGSTDINTTVFTITLKAIATADSTAMDFTVILHDENGTVPAAVVAKNVSVIECPHEHMTCTEVDGDYHIGVCDLCGHSRVMSHRYESVCHTTCVDCGHERVAPHVPSPEWNGNGDMHWHDCELCGVHLGAAPHAYDNAYDAACNECGHSRFVNGDMDHDADVDSDDAVYLLYAILFGTAAYPVEQPLDLNRDGEANEDDALYLLYHSFFGESEYPLQSA